MVPIPIKTIGITIGAIDNLKPGKSISMSSSFLNSRCFKLFVFLLLDKEKQEYQRDVLNNKDYK